MWRDQFHDYDAEDDDAAEREALAAEEMARYAADMTDLPFDAPSIDELADMAQRYDDCPF